jgi:Phage integrase, N-terminal SAM-like domain
MGLSHAARPPKLTLKQEKRREMARKSKGVVAERRREHGTVFALRFFALGRRRYVTLGSDLEGWTRAKAEDELTTVMAQVPRGVWQAPAPEVERTPDQTFHEFSSEWYAARKGELAPKTHEDYEWRLTNHLLPHFQHHRLRDIDIASVDRFREAKVREGDLSGSSVNKLLMLLGAILDTADERELIVRNPLRVNPRNRKVKAPCLPPRNAPRRRREGPPAGPRRAG